MPTISMQSAQTGLWAYTRFSPIVALNPCPSRYAFIPAMTHSPYSSGLLSIIHFSRKIGLEK